MYVLIATPCYGNMMMRGYFTSVLALKDLFNQSGIQAEIKTIGNESLITRARNYFLAVFLSNPKYTHLMFIDADITFNPMSVLRLLLSGKDVSGGCYPHKTIDWEKVKKLGDTDFLEQKSMTYVVNIVGEQTELPVIQGFIPVSYIGTGFMLIKREVVLKLVEAFPETKYTNDVRGYQNDTTPDSFYALFDCLIDKESKRYLSEDFAFCQRWLSIGGEIWADLTCDLVHAGTYEFSGSFSKLFKLNTPSPAPGPPTPAKQLVGATTTIHGGTAK